MGRAACPSGPFPRPRTLSRAAPFLSFPKFAPFQEQAGLPRSGRRDRPPRREIRAPRLRRLVEGTWRVESIPYPAESRGNEEIRLSSPWWALEKELDGPLTCLRSLVETVVVQALWLAFSANESGLAILPRHVLPSGLCP
ncbi:hypothetical protein Nepgr_001266 [Nepenthes gracilis]|uniref:Uncharacterized protein n=1 Tax=Nepenthes gracilis TaxID=150966 RepID=A0AAD3P4Z1_NEPGR|nr:hypothetical protein Nepgr_001266 [Nepenthes gracilis]